MARIKHLTKTEELKTNLLKQNRQGLFFAYDERLDALLMLIVTPDTETVVHYVDEHVGLLYTPDDLEIVGIQVEAFEHSFVPQHEKVGRAWRLSDTAVKVADLGEMLLFVENWKPKVAREVVQATPLKSKQKNELARAFAVA